MSVTHGVLVALTELRTLGRTLKKRATEVLAYFDRPGTSNSPTKARNGRLIVDVLAELAGEPDGRDLSRAEQGGAARRSAAIGRGDHRNVCVTTMSERADSFCWLP